MSRPRRRNVRPGHQTAYSARRRCAKKGIQPESSLFGPVNGGLFNSVWERCPGPNAQARLAGQIFCAYALLLRPICSVDWFAQKRVLLEATVKSSKGFARGQYFLFIVFIFRRCSCLLLFFRITKFPTLSFLPLAVVPFGQIFWSVPQSLDGMCC